MKKFVLVLVLSFVVLLGLDVVSNKVHASDSSQGTLVSFSFTKKAKEVKETSSKQVSKQIKKINDMVEEAKNELNLIKKIKAKLKTYIILASIGVGILLAWMVGLTFFVVKLSLKRKK